MPKRKQRVPVHGVSQNVPEEQQQTSPLGISQNASKSQKRVPVQGESQEATGGQASHLQASVAAHRMPEIHTSSSKNDLPGNLKQPPSDDVLAGMSLVQFAKIRPLYRAQSSSMVKKDWQKAYAKLPQAKHLNHRTHEAEQLAAKFMQSYVDVDRVAGMRMTSDLKHHLEHTNAPEEYRKAIQMALSLHKKQDAPRRHYLHKKEKRKMEKIKREKRKTAILMDAVQPTHRESKRLGTMATNFKDKLARSGIDGAQTAQQIDEQTRALVGPSPLAVRPANLPLRPFSTAKATSPRTFKKL